MFCLSVPSLPQNPDPGPEELLHAPLTATAGDKVGDKDSNLKL